MVEQTGLVKRFPNNDAALPADVTTFVDLSGVVDIGTSGEGGLLGMAFHPDFANNGKLYLSYTITGSPLISKVVEYQSADGGAAYFLRPKMTQCAGGRPAHPAIGIAQRTRNIFGRGFDLFAKLLQEIDGAPPQTHVLPNEGVRRERGGRW